MPKGSSLAQQEDSPRDSGTPNPVNSFRAYCQLIRLPNLFTAAADVLAGFFVTHPRMGETDLSSLWPVVLSGVVFYAGGVVLNDWVDREVDAHERPERPIPSGAIPSGTALKLGIGFLVVGLILTATVAWQRQNPWTMIIGFALTAAILTYNFLVKRLLVGPVVMGTCRALNFLLGASFGLEQIPQFWPLPLGLGLYVTGISIFARRETERSPRSNLVAGLATMFVGIGVLAAFPLTSHTVLVPQGQLWLLLAVLSLWILTRGIWTLAYPVPRRVQVTVTQTVLGIIVLDAAAAFVIHGPLGALPILALVLPTTWAGRWIAST
ncbi:MAG: UbiA family prenyltransferase [Thermogutta sp.]